MARTRKDVITAFRTAEILEAAHRTFAEKGFERATIADIARTAGVAKGTLYLYYRSKREVYWAALKRELQAMREHLRGEVEAAATIDAKLRAFIAAKLRYFDEHAEFCRIYFSELGRSVTRHAQHQRQLDEIHIEQAKMLEQALQQALRRRAIRHLRPEAAAFAVLDLTNASITRRMRGWSRDSVDEDIESTFDLVWKGIALR